MVLQRERERQRSDVTSLDSPGPSPWQRFSPKIVAGNTNVLSERPGSMWAKKRTANWRKHIARCPKAPGIGSGCEYQVPGLFTAQCIMNSMSGQKTAVASRLWLIPDLRLDSPTIPDLLEKMDEWSMLHHAFGVFGGCWHHRWLSCGSMQRWHYQVLHGLPDYDSHQCGQYATICYRCIYYIFSKTPRFGILEWFFMLFLMFFPPWCPKLRESWQRRLFWAFPEGVKHTVCRLVIGPMDPVFPLKPCFFVVHCIHFVTIHQSSRETMTNHDCWWGYSKRSGIGWQF